MHISVVVATCDRARLLAECLDSLLEQSRPPDQVLVVDDGSTDQTPEVLAGYGRRLEVLRCQNGGKARALNLAMDQVRGDYLWIFDDDDIALPDALERLSAVASSRPEVDIVYSSYASQLDDEPRVHKPLPEVESGDVFLRNLVQNFLQQQGMLVRTRCYRQVGPFDEQLVRSQDYDMAQRLTRRFRCAALPGPPTFVYRQHYLRRGRLGERFDHSRRDQMWLHYDRKIVERLLADVALSELLMGGRDGARTTELTAVERRRALLQRFCIVMRRGLLERGLDDLEAALEADVSPLEPVDEAIWRSTFEDGYGRRVALEELADDADRLSRFDRLLRGDVGDRLRLLLRQQIRGIRQWIVGQPASAELENMSRYLTRLALL